MSTELSTITSIAYDLVLSTKAASFPILPHQLQEPDIYLLSYQRYARLSGRSIEEISCGHALPDAYVTKNIRPGVNLILYNADTIGPRMRHSLWHEIGHIRLGHDAHGPEQEEEADYFASQAVAPDALLCEIVRRGYRLTPDLLVVHFRVSAAAAQRILRRFFARPCLNLYDRLMLRQFSQFLCQRFPPLACPRPLVKMGGARLDIRREG